MTFEEWYTSPSKQDERPLTTETLKQVFQDCWATATEAAKPRWIPVTERLPINHGYYPCLYIGLFQKTWDRRFFDGTSFERKYKDEPDISCWIDIPEFPE